MKGFKILLVICLGCSGVTNYNSEGGVQEVDEIDTIIGNWEWVSSNFMQADSSATPEQTGFQMTLVISDSTYAEWFIDGNLDIRYNMFLDSTNTLQMDPITQDQVVRQQKRKRVSGLNQNGERLTIRDNCEGCGVHRFRLQEN